MRPKSLRLPGILALSLTLTTLPASALAHTTAQGLGELANGALHPLTTPSHVLLLLGLGVLLGQHLPLRPWGALSVFAPLSAVALMFTMTSWAPRISQAVLCFVALGAAFAVATETRLPQLASSVLFGLAAVAIGLDSRVESASSLSALKTLLGTWIGLHVLLLNVAYYTSLAAAKGKPWLCVGLRVIGSWVAAISVLVLAFELRG